MVASTSIFKYKYYDTPDGHDLVKKLFYTNKQVSIIGFGLAASDIILVTKPVGYLNTISRFSQIMGPMYASTVAFCVTTHIATNLRQKDDEYNYAYGGFVSGALYGLLIKQKLLGMWLGVFCAIGGAVKKNSKLCGYEFFPIDKIAKPIHGDFRTPYKNWTLYETRPKGWIAAEERAE